MMPMRCVTLEPSWNKKNRPPKWTAGGARRKPDVRYEMLMMIEVVITADSLPGALLRLNRSST
tara:strand:- start:420 stop:608 length:189 start_codon:yes stop_codon:yes gene_type:complete